MLIDVILLQISIILSQISIISFYDFTSTNTIIQVITCIYILKHNLVHKLNK